MKKHLCPICEKHMFSAHDSYEICPVCGWENDGLQFNRPDYPGGANVLSQNDYRKQWLEKQAAKENK